MFYILLILVLLQIKHWYVDFVNQTPEEVASKGIYGDWPGIQHSGKHGIATMLIFIPFVGLPTAFVLGLIDFVIHYHVDWIKMRFGNRDIQNSAFWAQLGLDQMAHQLTYLGLIALLLI